MQRSLGAVERGAQIGERPRILIIAVHVAQQLGESLEHGFVKRPVRRDAVEGALPELIQIPAGLGHSDNWDVQPVPLHQRQQGGEDLLKGQIACGAEKHQRVGWFLLFVAHFIPF